MPKFEDEDGIEGPADRAWARAMLDDAKQRQRIPVCPPVPRERDVISRVFADMRAAVVEHVGGDWSPGQHVRRAS